MNAKILGHYLMAVGLAGLGFLSLRYDDYAMAWQPVPDWVPRSYLAYASGAILFGGGLGMLFRKTAAVSTLILTIFVLSWLLLLRLPPVISAPGNAGVWLGFGETSLLVAGGWINFISVPKPNGRWRLATDSGDSGLRMARLLFAVALPLIGLSHFVYMEPTASMVPAWLPVRIGWACLTGAGHIAAGLGLLFGIFPRLAATMEALMLSSFVLLLHAPGVASDPRSRLQWTMLCVAAAMTGAAWAVAGTLQSKSWGWSQTPTPKIPVATSG